MVLNKTNATTVADALGPVTENWMGHRVTLFAVWTDFKGKQVQGMRLRMAPAVAAQAPATAAPVAQPAAAAYQPPAQPATAPTVAPPAGNQPPVPTAAPVGPTNQTNPDPNAPLDGRWP